MSDVSSILTPLIVIGTLFLVFSCLRVQKTLVFDTLDTSYIYIFLSFCVLLDVKILEIDSILFTNLRVAMWWKILLEGVFRLNRGSRFWKRVVLVVLSSIQLYLVLMTSPLYSYQEAEISLKLVVL